MGGLGGKVLRQAKRELKRKKKDIQTSPSFLATVVVECKERGEGIQSPQWSMDRGGTRTTYISIPTHITHAPLNKKKEYFGLMGR